MATVQAMTYRVVRQAVPESLITPVLRLIYLDLKYRGVSARELQLWAQHPWPELRTLIQVQAIASHVDDVLERPGELCDTPQLVWHLPDEAPAGVTLEPHTDVPPAGREFALIAGVALSGWTLQNGTLCVWEHGLRGLPCPIPLDIGDVVVMTPDTVHSPGLNRSGEIRSGLYLRWLKPKEDANATR